MFDQIPLSRETIFAALAIVVSLIRYATYLHAIRKGEAKPHVFTWFNWSIAIGIGAYAQFTMNGGASVWPMVLVSVMCLFITVLALFKGEKNITRSDWYTFIGALLAIPVWLMTDNPLMAVVMLVTIDCLTYWPTVRKSWHDPWGEPPMSYIWSGSRYVFAMLAVPEFSLSVLVYPFFLGFTDWAFAFFLWWRRAALKEQH